MLLAIHDDRIVYWQLQRKHAWIKFLTEDSLKFQLQNDRAHEVLSPTSLKHILTNFAISYRTHRTRAEDGRIPTEEPQRTHGVRT